MAKDLSYYLKKKKRKRGRPPKRKVNKAKNRYKPWTEEEINIIMRCEKPDDELAKELGRDKRAIYSKRRSVMRKELERLVKRLEEDPGYLEEIMRKNTGGENEEEIREES